MVYFYAVHSSYERHKFYGLADLFHRNKSLKVFSVPHPVDFSTISHMRIVIILFSGMTLIEPTE